MVKASLNGLICQSGVTCKCAVAVNLLCGGCLWCRTDHVKYRLLFWIVLHGHESVKELILAGKEVSPVQQGTDGSHSEPRRVCEKGNCLSGPDVQQKQNVTVTVFQEINNTAVINTFSFFFSQGTWGAGVFLHLVCEWVGGSFVVKNQGLKSTQVSRFYLWCHVVGPM